MEALRNIFAALTRRTDPWCNMLQTFGRRIEYIGIILSDDHTLWRTKRFKFWQRINELIDPSSINVTPIP